MTNGLIYAYCLSNSPPDLLPGSELQELERLRFDDFYVFFKVVSESEFSEVPMLCSPDGICSGHHGEPPPRSKDLHGEHAR